jgi:hypothetical protein
MRSRVCCKLAWKMGRSVHVPTCFLTGCVRVTNKLSRGDSLVVSARNSVSSADAYHL